MSWIRRTITPSMHLLFILGLPIVRRAGSLAIYGFSWAGVIRVGPAWAVHFFGLPLLKRSWFAR